MSVLIFNGVTSASVHAHITEPPEYTIPERDYDTIHIDGRNGDLVIDSGVYNNVDRKYKMSMDATSSTLDYISVPSSIATWLHPNPLTTNSDGGYYKLTDTYDPSHFRYARFKGDEDISNIFEKAGEFDLTFDCKPQRYLTSGETAVTISSSGQTLTNPTSQIAKPIITFNSTSNGGWVQITNSAYGVTFRATCTTTGTQIVDCENEDCYNGSTNRNLYVTFLYNGNTSYVFPLLYPGTNTITYSAASSITIKPNWWEL